MLRCRHLSQKKGGEICDKKCLLSKIEPGPQTGEFHPPLSYYATATTLVEPGPSRVDACLSGRSLCFGGSALLDNQAIVGSTAVVCLAFRALTLAAHCARHWAP